ncbi:hypothetical protein GCM10017691_57080 [Pseudonocardia petroleophila]
MWPFVVTRNPVLDWRAIYAPAFLVAGNDDYRLVTATAGRHPEPGRIKRSGGLTLAFCSRPAGEVLGSTRSRDRFGRLVHVVEGVLAQGGAALGLHHLDAVREVEAGRIKGLVADFWGRTEEGVPPVASTPHLV